MYTVSLPRPDDDNGWGVHGDSNGSNPHWPDDVPLMEGMHLKWAKIIAFGANGLEYCRALLDRGIFPVVRLYRQNPNPGTLPDDDRKAVREYAKIGVRYFEPNNEPNLPCEWSGPIPSMELAADIVAANFTKDAQAIFDAGGFPIFPALAPVSVTHGGPEYPTSALLEACMKRLDEGLVRKGVVFGVHNYAFNHDLNGPMDVLADPCWFSAWRVPILLSEKLWGWRVKVIATEGGFGYGHWDTTYPPNTPERVRGLYVDAFRRMLGEDPNFMAFMPWLLRATSPGHDPKDEWAGHNRHVYDAVAALPVQPRTIREVPSTGLPTHWDSANSSSRKGKAPTHIVLHGTEGSLVSTYHWFTNPKGASAHIVADRDGMLYRVVPDTLAAWGAGYGLIPSYNYCARTDPHPFPNANDVTLHIELVCDAAPAPPGYTRAQLDVAALAVRNWMVRYKIPPERIVCHKDLDAFGRRTDPRAWDHADFMRKVMGDSDAARRGMIQVAEAVDEWRAAA